VCVYRQIDKMSAEVKSVQTPARALKRQLQRERRRTARTEKAALASECADEALECMTTASTTASPASPPVESEQVINHNNNDAIHAVIEAAATRLKYVHAGMKVSVKHTFIDVSFDEEESDEEGGSTSSRDALNDDMPLAQFETTAEFEEFRRAYRRFRLGHHQGAKGEFASPKGAGDFLDVSRWSLAPTRTPSTEESQSDRVSECCEDSPSDHAEKLADVSSVSHRISWFDESNPESGDELEAAGSASSMQGVKSSSPARMAKRQRQRERRRTCKAEIRAAREEERCCKQGSVEEERAAVVKAEIASMML
jgi:hypothetical protein